MNLLDKFFSPRSNAPETEKTFCGREFPQIASERLDPFRPLEFGEDSCSSAIPTLIRDVVWQGRQTVVSDGRKLLLCGHDEQTVEVIPLVFSGHARNRRKLRNPLR
jgi:hypothetical protein